MEISPRKHSTKLAGVEGRVEMLRYARHRCYGYVEGREDQTWEQVLEKEITKQDGMTLWRNIPWGGGERRTHARMGTVTTTRSFQGLSKQKKKLCC